MQPVKKLLPLFLIVTLSGCDLGEGSKLESLEIISASGSTITPPYQAYQCFRDRLNVIGRFTNGDAGNFSTRVVWSSSNEGVVKVLNAGEQNTRAVIAGKFDNISGSFYTSGVIVPKGLGTATVTATFLGLNASVDVVVSTPGLSVAPVAIGSPAAGPATGLGFANQFTVRTVLAKGQTIDAAQRRQDPGTVELLNPILWQFTDNNASSFVAGNAASTFSLDREDLNLFPAGSTRTTSEPAFSGNESVTINPSSGVLRAVRDTNPNPSVQAVFDNDPALGVFCAAPVVALSTPVAAVTNLVVSEERDFVGVGAPGDLVVSTDENLVTTANLAGGLTQDVSVQVGYEVDLADRDACVSNTDCTVATNRTSSIFFFSVNQMSTIPNTDGSFCDSRTTPGVSGDTRFNCNTDVDQVKVHACAPTCTTPTMTSANVLFRAVPATLTSYDPVTPAGNTTQAAFTFPGQQFSVLANFASATNSFSGGAAAARQNVSRYMGWVARPTGSTTEVSDLVTLFGLYGAVGGQTYYLRNPATTTVLDITAIPVISTRIGSFVNAGTLAGPTPATLTITPAP